MPEHPPLGRLFPQHPQGPDIVIAERQEIVVADRVSELILPHAGVQCIPAGSGPAEVEIEVFQIELSLFFRMQGIVDALQLMIVETLAVEAAVSERTAVAGSAHFHIGLVSGIFSESRRRTYPFRAVIVPRRRHRGRSFRSKISDIHHPVDRRTFVLLDPGKDPFPERSEITGMHVTVETGRYLRQNDISPIPESRKRRAKRFYRSRVQIEGECPFRRARFQGGVNDRQGNKHSLVVRGDTHRTGLVFHMPAAACRRAAHHADFIAAAPEKRLGISIDMK